MIKEIEEYRKALCKLHRSRFRSLWVGGRSLLPSPSAGDLRELPRVSLRVEGYCGVGERTRDCSPGQAGKEGPQLVHW